MKLKLSYFLVIFLFLSNIKATAQDDSLFYFFNDIKYPVTYFTANVAGELFVVNLENQLKKYNTNGDSVGVFNQVKKYGRLGYVEAQNPWQTLLFYPDFETVVLLDKYLNVLGSINLRDKNIFHVRAITNSYDNQIWLFDGQENKIKKLDQNGNLLMASVDLRQVFDSVPNPVQLVDRDGLLYLYDPTLGVYIFDYYGSFKNRLPFTDWKSISVIGKTIYGFGPEHLFRYTPPGPLPVAFNLPQSLQNAERTELINQRIYILKNNRLSVYKMR